MVDGVHGIGLVQKSEIAGIAQFFSISVEQQVAVMVKCPPSYFFAAIVQNIGSAVQHFSCSPPGKSQKQNGLRWCSVFNQAGNPIDQSSCFSGTGPGYDQSGPVIMHDRTKLLRVKLLTVWNLVVAASL